MKNSLDVRPEFYNKKGDYDPGAKSRSAKQRKQIQAGFDEFSKMTSGRPNDVLFSAVKWPDPKQYGGDRAYAVRSSVYLPVTSGEKTTIHELGHVLENRSESVHKQAVAFLERRTAGEEAQKLKDIYQGYDYEDHEIAKSDKFFNAYVGKVYQDANGKTYATEVVSMGMENMWHDPIGFAKNDPDYFDFIFGLLRSLQ